MRKVKYDFDPFKIAGIKPKSQKSRARTLSEVAAFVKEQVLQKIASGKSPVTGSAFPKLKSKSYKAKKQKEAGNTKANLELSGKMLDSLTVRQQSGKLRLTVGNKQQKKASGHNHWSGNGQSRTLYRPFIPDEKNDETFSAAITQGIKRITKRENG